MLLIDISRGFHCQVGPVDGCHPAGFLCSVDACVFLVTNHETHTASDYDVPSVRIDDAKAAVEFV